MINNNFCVKSPSRGRGLKPVADHAALREVGDVQVRALPVVEDARWSQHGSVHLEHGQNSRQSTKKGTTDYIHAHISSIW